MGEVTMDKSWLNNSRASQPYLEGVDKFLEFAFKNVASGGEIICPCTDCNNCLWHNRQVVYDHLVCIGFITNYTRWIYHGEASSSNIYSNESSRPNENSNEAHNMRDMLHDTFGVWSSDDQDGEATQEQVGGHNNEHEKFLKLMKDAEQELYPGCKKFSKLSFIVRLFHIKCLGGLSNKAFTMLLELLKEAFPEGETLPNSFYETKKIIGDLGLNYHKIDACPNDCMLYWKERSQDDNCAVCGASRWKVTKVTGSSRVGKRIPVKVLRHFPLKPRLQRLFMSSKTASSMVWHEKDRLKDGLLRHPADSLAWKTFDSLHPSFASDPRNVRLGLASDGFNPFRTMSTTHSTWPVVLVPYNLPPWMCLKQPYFMMSLLIPGPYAPGNDIDVYLQSLIDELNELWEDGLETFDASDNSTFQMHAALLWTISDFPAYANLSGWSTRGLLACPCCNKDTCSHYLKYGQKFSYMGHRRFMDRNHRYRQNTTCFNNDVELRDAPPLLSGHDVLQVKFCLDDSHKIYFIRKLGLHWKNWKYSLKRKYYRKYITYAQRLAHRDNRLDPNQWKVLLDFWDSDEGKKRSARNTANRQKLKMGHNTGTVSFAIVREKKKRPDGTAPKRADFFVDTHTFQENGRPIDTASSEIISKLQQLQPSNVGQGISQNGIAQNDELAQVMGADKNGHVRLLGFGPTPSSLWGTTSQSDAIKRAEEARKAAEEGQRAAEKAKKDAEEDARESRELMASMKIKVDGLESIVKSLARKISKKRSKKKRKMGRNANALDDDA